jgi:hypothetical protein
VLIIQLKGANMFNMISTLTIPLIQGAFAIPLINFIPDEFNWETIVGLFFIMIGLVRYQNEPHISRDQDEIIFSYQYQNGELSSDELFTLIYISSLKFWKDKIGHEIPGAKSQELEKGDHFKSRIVLPHSTPFLVTVESCSVKRKKVRTLGICFLAFCMCQNKCSYQIWFRNGFKHLLQRPCIFKMAIFSKGHSANVG